MTGNRTVPVWIIWLLMAALVATAIFALVYADRPWMATLRYMYAIEDIGAFLLGIAIWRMGA